MLPFDFIAFRRGSGGEAAMFSVETRVPHIAPGIVAHHFLPL